MTNFDQILDDCLDQIAQGKATPAECLAQYPAHAAELTPLLTAVTQMQQHTPARPSSMFKARTRANLLDHMRTHPHGRRAMPKLWQTRVGRAVNMGFGWAAMLLLFVMTGFVLAQLSEPGDALYEWRSLTAYLWDESADPPIVQTPAAEISVPPDAPVQPSPERAQASDDLSMDQSIALEYQVLEASAGHMAYQLDVSRTGLSRRTAVSLTTAVLSPAVDTFEVTGAPCVAGGDNWLNCVLNSAGRQTVVISATVDPCYAGVVQSTVTVGGQESAVVNVAMTPAFPLPAQIAYVQSYEFGHDIGLAAAGTAWVNSILHRRAGAPAWSADGQTLAFYGESGISGLGGIYGRGNGVWLIDIVNNQARRPRLLYPQDHIKNIAWSPDGSQIAIEVGPPGFPHQIKVLDARNGIVLNQFVGEQPAWHPDNQQLVVKGCMPDCGLWLVDARGLNGRQLTFHSTDSYPDWSPAGADIVFTSNRDDDWEIYHLNLDSTRLTRVTQRSGTDTTPVFDRCGQAIYLRTDHYGGWQLTTMRLNGTTERTILTEIGASDEWGLARPAIY